MCSSLKNAIWGLFIASLLSLFLIACDHDKAKPTEPQESTPLRESTTEPPVVNDASHAHWAAHISTLPKEFVSATAPIQVTFTHPVSGEHPIDVPQTGLVKVEPEVAFRAHFSADDRIQIEWVDGLTRGTTYKIRIFPNKLEKIDDALPPYTLIVTPFKQDYSVQLAGLKIDSASDEHSITGHVATNDATSLDQMRKLLAAEQDARSLVIEWQALSDLKYGFVVKDIERGLSKSTVTLSWDGESIGVDKKGQENIDVPSLQTFNVTGVVGHQTTEQYISVNFSEPLHRGQDMKGLILVNGNEPKSIRIDGNRIKVYTKSKISGDATLTVSAGVRSTKGARTSSDFTKQLTFLSEKPGVRFSGNKYIIPKQKDMTVTIEAVNVDSVQITAYRMPVANIGQFLQNSSLNTKRVDKDTSAIQWRKTYSLPEVPRDNWQKFDLNIENLTEYFGRDLLGLEVKINRSNSILECSDKRPAHNDDISDFNSWPVASTNRQPDWVEKYYRTQGYGTWRDRDNPCKDYFYKYGTSESRQFRYFTSSNIGLIAKMAIDHKMHVVATDILTAEPLKNISIKAYNFQHQPVADITTNGDGIAEFTPVTAPFYILARNQDDVSFLKLNRNEALSTNVFDVGGVKTADGIKGFFYGERGVWRPGDDIFLTFIIQDKTQKFPENYPLTVDFFDPKGVKHHSVTQAKPLNGFYHFKLKTEANSPTGNWRAVIRYANQYFDKKISVEAIVPNRLKIDLGFPATLLTKKDIDKDIDIFSQWLNGAPASSLKADIRMTPSASKTRVAGFDGFIFDDPSRKLKGRSRTVYKGNLDAQGKASFILKPNITKAPGQVRLNFTTRVFEKSGGFSTQYMSKNYVPYDQLVGISVPKGKGWGDSISRDETHTLSFLSVDPSGDREANAALDFSVYRIGWRWWWNYGKDDIGSYVNSTHARRLVSQDLTTDAQGNAAWVLDGKRFDWGRYLLRVCHKESHHCSGKVVYLGWAYDSKNNASGETQLMLTTDKKVYNVGDTAYLTIPQVIPAEEKSARFLLTLESGTTVLSQRWITADINDNRVTIPVTQAMAPNVYAHVTMTQAYQGKTNDRPIRMYGITPIMVEDLGTQREPVIVTKDRVRPASTMKIDVSESRGKIMTYTLAVVDEGLLGITNHTTPNPHKTFYQREALGVLTWDMYDLVSRSNTELFNSLISIGGSDSISGSAKKNKRRFPPVVKFAGPFALKENETRSHNITLPDYMGAVRVMVVAADHTDGQGAYGVAEKTVTVTQPLTLLATLPRVLGPNEAFSLPVTIFATAKNIKDVTLTVTANGLFEFDKEPMHVRFEKPGNQIVSVPFKTVNSVGAGKVTITVESAGETMSQTIDIPIRSANPASVISQSSVVEAGQRQELALTPHGMLNTNDSYIEISRIPDLRLSDRLDYLVSYPHGCLEQTISKLLPQIYLKSLLSLDKKWMDRIDQNVREGLIKLGSFQNAEGQFNYWPNGSYANLWANNYAGHFLLEAKRLGYSVPNSLLNSWLTSQRQLAADPNRQRGYEATDAYRLYTLALANKADFGAMNRLKERLNAIRTSVTEDSNRRLARWLLAASYARSGVREAAEALMAEDENVALAYEWSGYTYGSQLRDTSIRMLVYSELKNDAKAWESALDIANEFKKSSVYSTQDTAWALTALSNYFANKQAKEQKLSYRVNGGKWEKLVISSPVYKQPLSNSVAPLSVDIRNESEQSLYALLGNKGVPASGEEKARQSHVSIDVQYTDMEGGALDVNALAQGKDFKAIVTVAALDGNARLENLALTMTMPSGWQISNTRLEGKALNADLEYQDIRDDRILSYFTLGKYYWYHRANKKEITIDVTLNASFKGHFYLPSWKVESMYDRQVTANTVGHWVNVVDAANTSQ